MASASSLQCSICFDDFTEPVSTPCGHNYCKTCIMEYWDRSDRAQCPLCMKSFCSRPQLHVNTEFRDMVEHFNTMRVEGGDEVPAKPEEVACDVCPRPKRLAQKTCVVCLASFCQPHLELHRRAAGLKKHMLVDPVPNLEDRVCKKHDKMLELYCRTDQACVCFMCSKDDHVAHGVVPLEHVFRERKAWLENATIEIKMMENIKSRSVEETKSSVEQSKKESKREVADVVDVLTALVASQRRSQDELIELIQEKQKAATAQAVDRMTHLKKEIAQLKRRRSEMEQLLQTEDHLHLLQSWPSFHFPAHVKDLFNPPFTQNHTDISQRTDVGMVKKSVAQLKKILRDEMEILIRKVMSSDGCDAAVQADAAEKLETGDFIREVWEPPRDKLMMIQQCNEVNVTLDAATAHSDLLVSEDGKRLTFRKSKFFVPPFFRFPFQCQNYVLATDGFSSGRFYYEVQVSGSRVWLLGVVKESIDKQILHIPQSEDGGWTFNGYSTNYLHEYFAPGDNTIHSLRKLQTVGVFVDYEKGEVSFYDVEARTPIYSYTGCTFTETTPALKAFLYSMVGTSLSNRPKLYPIFGLFTDDMLVITPVAPAI
ncbi:E3 ubiquitin-protein ligase TRIM39-like [Embiotoca jacksoni]|uniref:E3 ubiquitin-protein ligase TRIM39-like n=1 Tax=Embiotoca jacksoni TaxID=100190 RepID=UPI003703B53D